MFDYESRVNELSGNRFCCSQILMNLSLDLIGCEDPEIRRRLVRAMNGLCGGVGGSRNNCGALTGAACGIGLICGRGETEEVAHPEMSPMVKALIQWFTSEYGSIECCDIVEEDRASRLAKCPGLMKATFENMVRIMLENGVAID